MNDAIALALYSGSALLPFGYLICTGFRGPRRRSMVVALGFHVLIGLLIIAYTLWCRHAGYREWYWNTAFHIPTNLVFLCIYLSILFSALPTSEVTSRDPPRR